MRDLFDPAYDLAVELVLDEVDAGVDPVLVVASCEGELMTCGGFVEYVTGMI